MTIARDGPSSRYSVVPGRSRGPLLLSDSFERDAAVFGIAPLVRDVFPRSPWGATREHAAMNDAGFSGLVARARRGEHVAIRELIDRYGREIRVVARARLPRTLRSRFDSEDFEQSVWKSFFAAPRVKDSVEGDPARLGRYLNAVARNKVQEEYRRGTTQKQNVNREQPLYVKQGRKEVPLELVSRDPSPSETAQAGDRLGSLMQGRTPEEREVVRLRSFGMTFDEIAERTGLNECAVRRMIDHLRRVMETRQWE